jgi:tRNA G37 N-methylase TrmD
LTTTGNQDFCEKMVLRIRTMAMHVRRAQAKQHPPKWLATVMVLKNVAPLTRSEQKAENQKEEELVFSCSEYEDGEDRVKEGDDEGEE